MLAERIAEIVKSRVNRVYCFPGGTIAPVLHYLDGCVDMPHFRSEQGAGYAAIGAAKVSGKAQVVMVTSGPGVTNVVTPVADAFFDSVPLVVICGQVNDQSKKVRQYGFQEVNTCALMKPICKKAVWVTAADVLTQLEHAFELAEEFRPGPVVIDLPMEVQFDEKEDAD